MQCTSFGNDVIFSSLRVLVSINCKQSITHRYYQRFTDIVLKLGGLPMGKLSYNDKQLVDYTEI